MTYLDREECLFGVARIGFIEAGKHLEVAQRTSLPVEIGSRNGSVRKRENVDVYDVTYRYSASF